jgi:hypothetical protein
MICWNCEKSENLPDKPNRLDPCPHCNSFLHCCYNCKFYDKNSHNECKETQAEFVKDKANANFCGYFSAGVVVTDKSEASKKLLTKEEAEKKWHKLFKKQ